MYTPEEIAQVCHEATRGLQAVLNDPAPAAPWFSAPEWQKQSCIEGVRKAMLGTTPRALHEAWLDHYRAMGWVYGPRKDEEARTHPCLVPYDELPAEQRTKNELFMAIVIALTLAPERVA